MKPLHITVDLSREPWPEVRDRPDLFDGVVTRIGLLPEHDGKPTVAILGKTWAFSRPIYISMPYGIFATTAKIFGQTATGILFAESKDWE